MDVTGQAFLVTSQAFRRPGKRFVVTTMKRLVSTFSSVVTGQLFLVTKMVFIVAGLKRVVATLSFVVTNQV